MKQIRACAAKTPSDLALEWDQLAGERHRQITSGEDISYHHILVPTMMGLLQQSDRSLVLDIGSGTGVFSALLAQVATRVIGVEPSAASLAIARMSCREVRNVDFIGSSLEEVAAVLGRRPITAAAACMTLMTTPNLRAFAEALAIILDKGAKFVATLSHPCFWPRYWGYETEPWFSYAKETFIEAPFVISQCRSEVITTHVHRPLEQYVRVFADAGFMIEAIAEPMPSPEIQVLYPQPWGYPRFLGLRWARAVP